MFLIFLWKFFLDDFKMIEKLEKKKNFWKLYLNRFENYSKA